MRRLVQTSVLQSDFLWLDDVYITGILASKAGVPLISVEVEQYLFIHEYVIINYIYLAEFLRATRLPLHRANHTLLSDEISEAEKFGLPCVRAREQRLFEQVNIRF